MWSGKQWGKSIDNGIIRNEGIQGMRFNEYTKMAIIWQFCEIVKITKWENSNFRESYDMTALSYRRQTIKEKLVCWYNDLFK